MSTVLEEILKSIAQEILTFTGEKVLHSVFGSSAPKAIEGTMTCTRCGQARRVQEVQVVRWKQNPRKLRRCKKCERMTLHSVTT